MKKLSTLFAVLMALLAMPVTAAAQDVVFDFTTDALRGYVGTTLADPQSYIYNETWTVDGVAMQVTAGAAPSRLTEANNRGVCLIMYKEYSTMTVKAPADKLITKIVFEQAGSGALGLVAENGSLQGLEWTGIADGVRFTTNGTPYLAKATVTLQQKDAIHETEYVECANIAAFNALENGTYAKLTLTDAEITGKSADGYSTVFIQDATGGAWIQYTSLNSQLEPMNKVNGVVYTVKRTAAGNPQIKEAEETPNSELTPTAIDAYTIVEGSLAEINVAKNLNRVVKITGAQFVATSATAGTLTQGDVQIAVNNGTATANQQLHMIADEWVKNETKLDNVTIVAILVAKSANENQLLPISMEEQTAAAWDVEVENIAEFNAVEDGKVVKLKLDNARVNAFNGLSSCYYVEDASGATVIKRANLKTATALNGYIVGKKASEDVDYVNTPSQGWEYSMTVEDATLSDFEATDTELVGTPMTIAEACVQQNYGRLVTLSNVDIKAIGNGMNKQLTDADGNTMKARDLLYALSNDYQWPDKAESITGVVIYYMTGWFLLPISEEAIIAGTTDAVTSVALSQQQNTQPVFDLQGRRVTSVAALHPSSIKIVNGQKVLVK